MFINTHAFTRIYFLRQLRYVYTEMLSHTETSSITDKYLYTEKILHRGTLHTDDITEVVLQGNECIYTRSFYIRTFLYRLAFT